MSRFTQFGNSLYTGERSFDFVGNRVRWYLIGGVLVVLAIAITLLRGGFSFGIEFSGGSEFRVSNPAAVVEQTAIDTVESEAGLESNPRVSIVGVEQRNPSPDSLLMKRKPPAAALAVPDFATSGSVTRAMLVPVFVMTDPGETPTSEMPALSHAGRIPGPVVKVKVPLAGTSSADAAGAAVMAAAVIPTQATTAAPRQRMASRTRDDDRRMGHSVRGEAGCTSG